MNPSSFVVHACLVFCFVGCNGSPEVFADPRSPIPDPPQAAELTTEQAVAAINGLPKLPKPLDLWPLHPTDQRNAALVKALTDRVGAVCLRPKEIVEGKVEIPPAGVPWAIMDQPHQLAELGAVGNLTVVPAVTAATCDQVTRDSFHILQQVHRKAVAAGNLPLRIHVDDEWAMPAGWTVAAWQSETIRRQQIHDSTYAQFFPSAPRNWYSSGQVNGRHVPVRVGTHDGLVVYFPDVPSINDAILIANHPLLVERSSTSPAYAVHPHYVPPAALWLSIRYSFNGGTWRDINAASLELLGARFAGRGDASRDVAIVAWNRAEFGLLYDHEEPPHKLAWCLNPRNPSLIAALRAVAKGASK